MISRYSSVQPQNIRMRAQCQGARVLSEIATAMIWKVHGLQVRLVGVEVKNDLAEVCDLWWTRDEIIAQQKADPELPQVCQAVEKGSDQPPW